MAKPYLLVVTGRPGSGKTTLARKLGESFFLPVISRDQVKEGYVHTLGKRHDQLPDGSNKIATDIFFDVVDYMLGQNVSLIAEAAFQHKIWAPRLEPLLKKARTYILICKPVDRVAFDRYIKRGLKNPLREYFHGDKGVDMARRGIRLSVSPYDEPVVAAPTFHIDTSGEYDPSIEALGRKIFGDRHVGEE